MAYTHAPAMFMAALGLALAAIVIAVYRKSSKAGELFIASDPAPYSEIQARREPPKIHVNDPNPYDLAPEREYVNGGPSPSALQPGSGPYIDGDLHVERPPDPYVHGTEPAYQGVEAFDGW